MKKILKKVLNSTLIILCAYLCFSFVFSSVGLNSNYDSYAETHQTSVTYARDRLSDKTKHVYDFLVEKLKKVADGSISETTFEITSEEMNSWGIKTSYTNTEVGLPSITLDDVKPIFWEQIEKTNLLQALLHDLPYELYWFDKTVGYNTLMHYAGNTSLINITKIEYIFNVANSYKSAGYDEDNPSVNSTKITAANLSLNNAKLIVEQNKTKNDYQKLLAYKKAICDLVSYNDTAAESTSAVGGYGDPWQLIYVFDNDSSTNVVCEGYAKAFQLLCNLTAFDSSYIECYTISGTLTGSDTAGGHMWNVVTMDDELHYLVDITNTDTGMVGQEGELFLAGTLGSITSSYSFNLSHVVTYTYSTNQQALWGTDSESILDIAHADYEVVHPTIKVETNGDIIYDKAEIRSGLKGTSSCDVTYEFESDVWHASDYNWSVKWLYDDSNLLGGQLTNAPVDAGVYWIKITAENKLDPNHIVVHCQQITILKKEISISEAQVASRVYDGSTSVQITNVTLSGVLGSDDVGVNLNILQGSICSANVGAYTKVGVSNIQIDSHIYSRNYTIQSTILDVPCNNIEIQKATLNCSEQFTKITEQGKTLNDIQMQLIAKGVNNATIAGTYTWISESGEAIDLNTEIAEMTSYKYKFVPADSNYDEYVGSVILWGEEEETKENFFSLENLPKIIEYSLYAILAVVVLACVIVSTKKKVKQKKSEN